MSPVSQFILPFWTILILPYVSHARDVYKSLCYLVDFRELWGKKPVGTKNRNYHKNFAKAVIFYRLIK